MTPAADVPAIEIDHLTVTYRDRPVLWDVDVHMPRGTLGAIVGPNGSGKSTLLRAALGLVPTDSGRIAILGRPSAKARAKVAYVPQREAVDWDFPITVREVVEMGRYRAVGWFRRMRREDRDVVDQALERVGMGPFARRQIGQLSGGQRQRVFIARALAQRAELLVLDEPFAGVDVRTEHAVLELLRTLRDDEGRSIVIVHHDLETVARSFDWALLLNVRPIATGRPDEVLTPENLRRAYGAEPAVEPTAAAGSWAG